MQLPGAYHVKVVPTDHADHSGSMRERVNRAAVEAVGSGILLQEDAEPERWSFLREGTIIYYIGGTKVGDAVYVNIHEDQIICYEEE